MTEVDAKLLKQGDHVKCTKTYLEEFHIGEIYQIKRVEDVNRFIKPGHPELMYTLTSH